MIDFIFYGILAIVMTYTPLIIYGYFYNKK